MSGKQHWTEEMYQIVRDGWPAGKSASVLAAELNKISATQITRNAVVSRAKFLGVTTPNQKVNQFAFKPQKAKPPKPVVPAKSLAKIATEVERTAFDASPALDESGQPYTLENCGAKSCRFIPGPVAAYAPICGHRQQENSPYCPEHHARCFVAPTPYYKKPEPRYR